MKTPECVIRLMNAGINRQDAMALRRIAMTLHAWHERECGDEYGCIERDEETNKPYFLNALSGKRWPIPDRERGALSRLKAIMQDYPTMLSYVQGDPRGAPLYILKASDLPEDVDIDANYYRGIAVYK